MLRTIPAIVLLVCGVVACAPDGPQAASSELSDTPSGDPPSIDKATGASLPAPATKLGPSRGPAAFSRSIAPQSDPDASLPSLKPPRSVAVVGDSLTVSAEPQIEMALRSLGVGLVTIDGLSSRRMVRGGSELPPGVDAIDDILEVSRPELWVVALGTNDVGSGRSPDEIRHDTETLLGMIPRSAPVVWVDLWIRDLSDEIVEANKIIRSVVEDRPNSVVVDWYSHGEETGQIMADGIHLTDTGRQEFAELITLGIVELQSE